MSSAIQQAINEAVKDAMRAKAKERLSTLRLITAEFKRIEVDERIELDDARVLAVLDKSPPSSTATMDAPNWPSKSFSRSALFRNTSRNS
jgi:hypothetical protein